MKGESRTYCFVAQENPLALTGTDAIVRQDRAIVGHNDIAVLEFVDLRRTQPLNFATPTHADRPEAYAISSFPIMDAC